MLGIDSPRKPVRGIFVKVVRDSLQRSQTGNLTASELKARQSLKEASRKWKMVWKQMDEYEFSIEPLKDFSVLHDFDCGVESMNKFIRNGFRTSIDNHLMFMTLYAKE